jgi:hypothetical protein
MNALATYRDIRLSTDALPPSERLTYLREVLGRSICRVDLSPAKERPLKWTAEMRPFDDLTVSSGQTSGHLAHRGPTLLADGNDDLLFTTNRSGFSLVSQLGREGRLDAGAAVLGSSAEPGSQDFPGSTIWLTLRIPRRRLAGLIDQPEDAVIRPIPAGTEALRLLVDYVDTVLRRDRLASPQLQRAFTTHACDLVALAAGASRDATEFASGRGLRAGRLNAAKWNVPSQALPSTSASAISPISTACSGGTTAPRRRMFGQPRVPNTRCGPMLGEGKRCWAETGANKPGRGG